MRLLALLGSALAALSIGLAAPLAAAPPSVDPGARLVDTAKAAMQVDPAQVERIAEAAERTELSKTTGTPNPLLLATAQWLRGEALFRMGRVNEAAPLIERAILSIAKIQPNSKLHADLLMSRGRINFSRGDAYHALVNYQAAFRIFAKLKDTRSQAVALQSIGNIYVAAGDANRVFYYYRLAEEMAPSDKMLILSSNNNQGLALSNLRRYREAEEKYYKALKIGESLGSTFIQASIIDNIADGQIADKRLDVAEKTLRDGLRRTASGEAADLRPILLGTSARLALRRGRIAEAAGLLKQALAVEPADIATPPYLEFNRTAYQVFKKTGDDKRALRHFELYTALDAEARSLASSTNSSLLAAQFDFANQNVSIANLKAGQLQRDVALVRLQGRQNALILGGLLAFVALVAGVLAIYLRILQRSRNAIRAVNDALSKANVELEAALLVKSQFLATTSHEIRTPLNAVLGMTQILLADRQLTPDVRERIGLVHGAGETMRMLVDDILEFAKIDSGNLDVFCADMDFHELLRELVRFWDQAAVTKGLTLTLDLGDTPPNIVSDIRRCRQILFNLLSNAIKFTLQGGIAVKAAVVMVDGAEQLTVAVSDSGIGIPATAFDTIFDKFNQLDSSTTRQFGGTGLGLAISRSLAEALGGGVAVDSALGSGSTFTLTLPLVRAAVAAPAAAAVGRADSAGLDGAALVLVGGNPIAQSVLRNLLASSVNSFATVADFAGILELCRAGAVDVALVEGGDFVEQGFDAVAAGIAGVAAYGVRIAVIWPSSDPLVHARLLDSGAGCVIGKPVRGDALRAALANLFDVPETLGETAETTLRKSAAVR